MFTTGTFASNTVGLLSPNWAAANKRHAGGVARAADGAGWGGGLRQLRTRYAEITNYLTS